MMFWTGLMHQAKMGGIGAALVAAGALGQSIIDKSEKLPWLHRQASELRATRTDLIPKLAAKAQCEHKRAEKAVDVAVQALSANVAPVAEPGWEDLPADCPHTKN